MRPSPSSPRAPSTSRPKPPDGPTTPRFGGASPCQTPRAGAPLPPTPRAELLQDESSSAEAVGARVPDYNAAWFGDHRGLDPPPLKWSDLRYVFDIKEDCNGKEAIQA